MFVVLEQAEKACALQQQSALLDMVHAPRGLTNLQAR